MGSQNQAPEAEGEVQSALQIFQEGLRGSPYPRPSVTVDLAIFTVADADLKILLVRRKEPPFAGDWALPGGFVRVGDAFGDQGEDIDAAAHRELAEETGLPRNSVYLEQLHAFGRPYHDPRTRVITIAYTALVPQDRAALVVAGSDAADARWFSLQERPPLAFDHADILDLAVARLRARVDQDPIAFELVPPTFTVAELRAVFEAIGGAPWDAANFRRRFRRMQEDGVIEPAPGRRTTRSKPAAVFRFCRGRRDR